jgi:hypothetical protein
MENWEKSYDRAWTNIWHVYPLNDLQNHLIKCDVLVKEGESEVKCFCSCEPKMEVVEDDAIIVTHNSFDKREAIEWANEILDTTKPFE